MIRLQVVNLLSEYQRPHILAQKFDHIQRIRKPRPISREPVLKQHVLTLAPCFLP